MQTRKIIGIALVAALVGSMAAVSVSARDQMEAGEEAEYFDSHTIGIVGSLTGWGGDPDATMSDIGSDKVFVGAVTGVAAGDTEFKYGDRILCRFFCLECNFFARTPCENKKCFL